MKKCIVQGCQNHKGEGGFVGELVCSPCHAMLTTGTIGHGTTFIHQLKKECEALDAKCVSAAKVLMGVS